MAGVDQQTFAWGQGFFDHFARQVEEDCARAGDALHDEAFAGEEAGAQALLEEHVERDRVFGAQECFLAADHRLAGRQLDRDDLAGEARGEGDVGGVGGGEFGDEQAAAGECAFQAGHQAATGVGFHADRGGHPRHGCGLAVELFAAFQVD